MTKLQILATLLLLPLTSAVETSPAASTTTARSTLSCSDYDILDGSCPDACACPCGDGLGVLVNSVPSPDCDEKPEQVCMDPIVAYDMTLGGKATCLLDCPVPDEECDSEDDSSSSDDKKKADKPKNKSFTEPKFKTCTEQQVINGSCPDACECTCKGALGSGVFVETIDADSPHERLCMGPMHAYRFVQRGEMKCVDQCKAANIKPRGVSSSSKSKKEKYGKFPSKSNSSDSGSKRSTGKPIFGNECRVDSDCTQIRCFAPPCDATVCIEGECVIERIKDPNEADDSSESRSGKSKNGSSDSDSDDGSSSSRSGVKRSGRRKKITVCHKSKSGTYDKARVYNKNFKKWMDDNDDDCLPGDEVPGMTGKFFNKKCKIVDSEPKVIDDEPCDRSGRPLRKKPRRKNSSSSKSKKEPSNKTPVCLTGQDNPEDAICYPLMATQSWKPEAGQVCISMSEYGTGKMDVKFTMNEGSIWSLWQANVWIGEDASIPLDNSGNLDTSLFPFRATSDGVSTMSVSALVAHQCASGMEYASMSMIAHAEVAEQCIPPAGSFIEGTNFDAYAAETSLVSDTDSYAAVPIKVNCGCGAIKGKNGPTDSDSDSDSDDDSSSSRSGVKLSGRRKKITVCHKGKMGRYTKAQVRSKIFKKWMDENDDDCLPGDAVPRMTGKFFTKHCKIVEREPKVIDDEPCDRSGKALRKKPRRKNAGSKKGKKGSSDSDSDSDDDSSSSRSGVKLSGRRKKITVCHKGSMGRYTKAKVRSKVFKKWMDDNDDDCLPGDAVPNMTGKFFNKHCEIVERQPKVIDDEPCDRSGKALRKKPRRKSSGGSSTKASKDSDSDSDSDDDSSSRSRAKLSGRRKKITVCHKGKTGTYDKARVKSKVFKKWMDDNDDDCLPGDAVPNMTGKFFNKQCKIVDREPKVIDDEPCDRSGRPLRKKPRRKSSGGSSKKAPKDAESADSDSDDDSSSRSGAKLSGRRKKITVCHKGKTGTYDKARVKSKVFKKWMDDNDDDCLPGDAVPNMTGKFFNKQCKIVDREPKVIDDEPCDRSGRPLRRGPRRKSSGGSSKSKSGSEKKPRRKPKNVNMCQEHDGWFGKKSYELISVSPKDVKDHLEKKKCFFPGDSLPGSKGKKKFNGKCEPVEKSESGKSNSSRSGKAPKKASSSGSSSRSGKAPKKASGSDSSSRSGKSTKRASGSGSSSRSGKSGKKAPKNASASGSSSRSRKPGKKPSASGSSSRSGKSPKQPKPEFKTCKEQEIRSGACADLCRCPCYNDSIEGVFVATNSNQMTCMDAVDAYDHTVIAMDMTCVEKCPPTPKPEPEPVICTHDVKECWDGTYVTRRGPQCEFAACPPTPDGPGICLPTLDFDKKPDGTLTRAGDPADLWTDLGIDVYTLDYKKPAMLFDTANPTGGDTDLAHKDLGMVLIISEDGKSSNPDDNAHGGTIIFEFKQACQINSIGLFDLEEQGTLTLFDITGETIGQPIKMPTMKDGETKRLSLMATGVGSIEVKLAGSGAITDIEFCPEEGEPEPEPESAPRCNMYITKTCWDGSVVRPTAPNCELAACPPEPKCNSDTQNCWDGSSVTRIGPNCEFAACPPGPEMDEEYWLPEEQVSKGCETAFAYDPISGSCFSDYGIKGRWGWTIGLTPDTYSFEIYAGAAQCDVDKGTKVGTLEFQWDGDSGYVTYIADDFYKFEETHFNIGWDPLPKEDKGKDTVAPGQYSVVHDVCENSKIDHITFSGVQPNPQNKVYIIAHAVSCDDA